MRLDVPTETSAISLDLTVVDTAAWRARARNLLLVTLHENALLIIGTVIYLLIGYTTQHILGLDISPLDQIWATYIGTVGFFLVAGFCVFALWFIYLKRIRHQPDLLDYVGAHLREVLSPDRIFLILPALIIWPAFVNCFSYLKVLITRIQPFYLDPYLMRLDRLLHFGRLPSEWLGPILNYPLPLFILNWIYAFWFLIFMTVLLMQMANTSQRHLRSHYLLAQMLLWPVFGNLLATVLSSAGPAYYGLIIGGNDPYAAHMLDIKGAASHWGVSLFGFHLQLPFTAIQMQQILWNARSQSGFLGMGISACPSLHVASAWLIARLSHAYGRRAMLCGYSFLVLIFLASIQLGWHYAVDGYLGMLGAWLCWRVAGHVLALKSVQRLVSSST